jgi:hypothetical protein
MAAMLLHYFWRKTVVPLRVTPAMEAGLAHHVWTIEELVAIMPEPVAKKRGQFSG